MSNKRFVVTFPWRQLWLAAALISAVGTACAQSSDPLVVRREADAWLTRIHRAASHENYQGTFVFQRGSTVQSSRIEHVADHSGEYERLESLDGSPRTMLRHNEDIYTFIPERKVCLVDQRQSKDSFPALVGKDTDAVLDVYTATLLGAERIAGRDAQVIGLAPVDHYRFGYKLWADQATGLLLRAQTLDADGHVLEQIAFTQVQIGISSEHNTIAAGIHNLAGWRVIHANTSAVDMSGQGWTIKPSVAGFREIRELRRPMASHDPANPVMLVDQAVFSDGLTAVSVFIEPVEKAARKEGVGNTGATHILVKRQGKFWITLLGEVPSQTLQEFASAVEYKEPK
jgi:sigma-E factor negative regulatory protein RseB